MSLHFIGQRFRFRFSRCGCWQCLPDCRSQLAEALTFSQVAYNGSQVGGRFNAANLLLWAGLPPSETLGKCGKCKIVEHLFARAVPMNMYLSIEQQQTPTTMSTQTTVTISDLKSTFGDVVDARIKDTRDLAAYLHGISLDSDGDRLRVGEIGYELRSGGRGDEHGVWDTGVATIRCIKSDGLTLYYHQDDGRPMTTTVYDKDPGIRKYLKGWDRPEGGYGELFSEWGA